MKPTFGRHAKAKPTRDYQRSRLASLLIMRPEIDSLTPEELARWHGLPADYCADQLAAEKVRRASR